MKKGLFLIAAMAGVLASCTNEGELAQKQIATQDNALSFNAYMGEAVTKGVVEVNTDITKQGGTGIGVFAFYQPAVSGTKVDFNTRKFATPDFMYNQKVNCPTIAGTWEYSPVKFWPNNTGDQLSFFAYAPYKDGTTWDDLGIATDATASKITASFPIYNEKTAMKDILWTDPQLNKTKASTTAGATDNPIVFSFRHLLSKVAIYVGVEQNTATGSPTIWNDENTTITIDKIEFTNLADAYNYSCAIPMSNVTDKTTCWSASATTQDIVLTNSNGDFETTSAVINNSNYNTAAFKNLLAEESNKEAFLFLAPQTFTDDNEQAIITYTVKTTASTSANNSTITNTIATDLYDILSGASNAFTTGKAYTLNFLIGMNSVKISASVTEWEDATEHQIDAPENDGVNIVGNVPVTNYTSDDETISFTLANTLNCTDIEYEQSASEDGTYSEVTNVTVSGNVVTINKSDLDEGTHYIKVTGDYTSAVSGNAPISAISETASQISISLGNQLTCSTATCSQSDEQSGTYTDIASGSVAFSGNVVTITKSDAITGSYIKVAADFSGAVSGNAPISAISETASQISITLGNQLTCSTATCSQSDEQSGTYTDIESGSVAFSDNVVTITKSDAITGSYIKVAADFSGAVTSSDNTYVTISNISETSDKVSFTVKTVADNGQYFSKLEFGESSINSNYTINASLTKSNLNANSYDVEINKTYFTDGTKYIQVTATKAITLATCENCSASFSSETDDVFTFSISQDNDQQAYQSFSVYTSTDGTTWSTNVLQTTEENGKCTKSGDAITYKKSSTSINSIKVKANRTLTTTTDGCTASAEAIQDADSYTITVTTNKANINVYAKTANDAYTSISNGTAKGCYSISGNAITYYKRDSEEYTNIKIWAHD